MYKLGGKARKLLGMWVCGSGEMTLERKIWSVSTEVVIKVLGQFSAHCSLVACFCHLNILEGSAGDCPDHSFCLPVAV